MRDIVCCCFLKESVYGKQTKRESIICFVLNQSLKISTQSKLESTTLGISGFAWVILANKAFEGGHQMHVFCFVFVGGSTHAKRTPPPLPPISKIIFAFCTSYVEGECVPIVMCAYQLSLVGFIFEVVCCYHSQLQQPTDRPLLSTAC